MDKTYKINYIEKYKAGDMTLDSVMKAFDSDANRNKLIVSSSPYTPINILIEIARRNQDEVNILVALAENINATPALLEYLAHHGHPSVRETVTKHPNTPDFVLEVLSEDRDGFVRYYAKKNLDYRKNK